ncbi:MAG: prolyl-tRNA synthetase associated domain-containing protein [Clostridia bacterium]|nr:prolyl-tRNA synthetase associated domain-containing protein [Clostridia bacterium]
MKGVCGEVLAALERMGIPYRYMEHEPVQNMDDCAVNAREMGAVMPKNLFLTPKNGKSFWLCIVPAEYAFKTSDVSKQLGSARLSFAPAEKLAEFLRTEPGAIGPLGLMFDGEKRVQLAMARSLEREPVLAFHPCVPDATVALAREDFFRFVQALGVEVHWVEV